MALPSMNRVIKGIRKGIRIAINNPSEFGPTASRVTRQYFDKQKRTQSNLAALKTGHAVTHFGVHDNYENTGDVILLMQVRDLIENQCGKQEWNLIHIHEQAAITDAKLHHYQDQSKAFLLGGGGYIFPGGVVTVKKTGWCNPLDLDFLDKLTAPLVTFAIGFNSIGDDGAFAPEFRDNINKFVDKSFFFSLRNRGSINALKNYLEPSLHHKLSHQPCPTTIMRSFHPDIANHKRADKLKTIAFNVGVDYAQKRFGGTQRRDEILADIAKAAKILDQKGFEIYFVTHTTNDTMLEQYFQKEGVKYRTKRLERANPKEVIDFYKDINLTLSMRGHGQMIPFGCGNAILSLSLHNKLRFLLQDLGHPEWAIELDKPNIIDEIIGKVGIIDADLPKRHQELDVAREALWEVTKSNFTADKLGGVFRA